MRLILILAAATALTACKKKAPEQPAAPTTAPEPALTVQMPHEASAKKLAEKLVANGLDNVNPTGSTDFSMKFDFKPDGNWSGAGHAELGGETLDCIESGTWKIDEMVEEKGRVEWTIIRTNCPNRSANDVQRALVGFEGKEATISFR